MRDRKLRMREVEARVRKIKEMKGDNEAAHVEEDNLYEEVLRAIVAHSRYGYASDLARAALRTKEIGFERWYA